MTSHVARVDETINVTYALKNAMKRLDTGNDYNLLT